MGDDRRSTRSVFWPLLLIGAGGVFLLVNLGLIPRPTLGRVLSLWPLILIGIGLNLILGRRYPVLSPFIALGVIVAAIALVALAPSLGLPAQGELKTEQVSEPIGAATSATVTLDLSSYPTTVDGGASSGTLIEAELDTTESIDFVTSGTSEKSISLRERTVSGVRFGFPNFLSDIAFEASWEIHLNPVVPLKLTVDLGSGRADLDLTDLSLTRLDLDVGSGGTNAMLPGTGSGYELRVDGGSGSVDLTLADGANVEATIDVGSGPFTLGVGDAVDLLVDLDGGSGPVRIEVPERAAVRLVVRDSASGSVSVPGELDLVDDGGDDDRDTGIWETSGYLSAEYQIEIVLDPGSGSFGVR